MKIIIIAALAPNGVIGRDGELPWPAGRYPAYDAHFDRQTAGHVVVAGRITVDALGPTRLVQGRTLIEVTALPGDRDGYSAPDPARAVDLARNLKHDTCFLVGGRDLFTTSLPLADELDITLIGRMWEGYDIFPHGRALHSIGMGLAIRVTPELDFVCTHRTPCRTDRDLTFTRWVRR